MKYVLNPIILLLATLEITCESRNLLSKTKRLINVKLAAQNKVQVKMLRNTECPKTLHCFTTYL